MALFSVLYIWDKQAPRNAWPQEKTEQKDQGGRPGIGLPDLMAPIRAGLRMLRQTSEITIGKQAIRDCENFSNPVFPVGRIENISSFPK